MLAKIIQVETYRGHVDDVSGTAVEIQSNLWTLARQLASEARHEARPQNDYHSRAFKINHGGYQFLTGEESSTIVIPEGHPLWEFDYDDVPGWDEATYTDWEKKWEDIG